MKNRMMWWIVMAMATVTAVACDDAEDTETADTETGDTETEGADSLDIVGSYTDDWGSSHVITEESWTATFEGFEPTSAEILMWDNDAEYLTAENVDGTFARYDWAYEGDDLYYCQIEFMAATEEAAAANDSADRGDLAGAGCGGFSWSMMTPVQ